MQSKYYSEGTDKSKMVGYVNDVYDLSISLSNGQLNRVGLTPKTNDSSAITRQLMTDLTYATLKMQALLEFMNVSGKIDDETLNYARTIVYGDEAEVAKRR